MTFPSQNQLPPAADRPLKNINPSVSFKANSSSSAASAHAMAELSFSECLQLERLPADGVARAAKVLSVREGMPAYLHCPRQQNGSNLKVTKGGRPLNFDAIIFPFLRLPGPE